MTETTSGKTEVPKDWKEPKFEKGDMKHALLEESSFKILFPKYREKQIKEAWPLVENFLKDPHEIACELDLVENTMLVKTTKKTWDPYAIMNARDMIKCLSRSVPLKQCFRVFEDDLAAQFIKIDGMVRNQKKFRKRRERLIGPDGATLQALEILTNCYILVAGKTVTAIGPYKSLKEVFRFVTNCMNNIHPVYMIKEMMIKRELQKDPKMANENWSKFLPNFKTDRSNRKKEEGADKKPKKVVKKSTSSSEKSPFVSENHFTPSKIDKQLESGEYFLNKEVTQKRKLADKDKENKEKTKEKKRKKMEEQFTAPKEDSGRPSGKDNQQEDSVDVQKLKEKLSKKKKKDKKSKKAKSAE